MSHLTLIRKEVEKSTDKNLIKTNYKSNKFSNHLHTENFIKDIQQLELLLWKILNNFVAWKNKSPSR